MVDVNETDYLIALLLVCYREYVIKVVWYI
jgi:hypothetical protein